MPSSSPLSRASLALLYACATLSAWWVGPDGPVYWDSFGYVIQSITGRVGGLMLGRPTFVLSSHALVVAWRALGGGLYAVEPLLRCTWMLVSGLGAPALACVAIGAGLSTRVAFASGALLALSPAVAHSSRAVLTDAPSMAVTLVAFGLALRATRRGSIAAMFSAGVVLGLAAGLREQAVLHLVTFAALALVAPRRRIALGLAGVGGCFVALGLPVVWLVFHQRSYLATLGDWVRSMAVERAHHPRGWRDLAMYLVWSLASGPVALVAASAALSRSGRVLVARDSRVLALVVPSALQFVALAAYQDIAFSPRYLLAALPCAVVLPAGIVLDARWPQASVRRALFAATVGLVLGAGIAMRAIERPLRSAVRDLPRRLRTVPATAAVVTGQLCPAVVYYRELGRLEGGEFAPSWVQVCPGWRWPPNLATRLDALRASGHTVVIDLRDAAWVGDRQRSAREDAARYALAHGGEVTIWR